MFTIIRGLHSKDFAEISAGTYAYDKVAVYYGYNTYRNDMEYINGIVNAVKFEHPEIKLSNMHVHHFTKYHSAHYDHTFIKILLPVALVKENIHDYTKL